MPVKPTQESLYKWTQVEYNAVIECPNCERRMQLTAVERSNLHNTSRVAIVCIHCEAYLTVEVEHELLVLEQ
jgi:uncharacterized CHY-type Zn-finger protein